MGVQLVVLESREFETGLFLFLTEDATGGKSC